MTKEQLQKSIEEITQAIKIVVSVGGMCYHKSTEITNKLSDERSKMQKQLNLIEREERKALRMVTK